MKKFLTLLCAVMLVVMMVGSASAISYTSTFDVAGDFSLTGFSQPGSNNNPPTATNGPDSLVIDDPTGTYSPDVPPPGTYDWYVEFNSLTLDFFGDSTPELEYGHKGPYFVGTYASPTPGLTGSYNFGDVYFPSHTHTYNNVPVTVGNYTVHNLNVDWAMTMSGTDITNIALTITADDLDVTLNNDLTNLDNYLGGANGVIDGHATADFSVTAVPEPSTILLMGLGLLGLVGYSRKHSKKS